MYSPLRLYTHYPDLTELSHFHFVDNVVDEISVIPTEFAFYVQSMSITPGHNDPTRHGFEALACMNNWWPSHHGETRTMKFWWRRTPRPFAKPLRVKRARWGLGYNDIIYKKHEAHLAKSGCGFKIGEPPFKADLFNRFFTLMRMPVKVSLLDRDWLKEHNYKLIDTGEQASYWLNGWEPKIYTPAMEYTHFKTSRKEWDERGMQLDY